MDFGRHISHLNDECTKLIHSSVVITSPSHVFYELLLNSLDSGAFKISSSFDMGSMNISVFDNGNGISPEDFQHCGEHHFTSRISCFEDLATSPFFGYKGESLACIGDISFLQIESKVIYEDESYVKIIKEGKTLYCGFASGCKIDGVKLHRDDGSNGESWTKISVNSLFSNQPVRRRFLFNEGYRIKSEGSNKISPGRKWGISLLSVVRNIWMVFPQLSLSFIAKGGGEDDIKFISGKGETDEEMFAFLFGKEKIKHIFHIQHLQQPSKLIHQFISHQIQGNLSSSQTIPYFSYSFTGLVSKPLRGSRSKRMQFIFINGRLCKTTLLHTELNNILSFTSSIIESNQKEDSSVKKNKVNTGLFASVPSLSNRISLQSVAAPLLVNRISDKKSLSQNSRTLRCTASLKSFPFFIIRFTIPPLFATFDWEGDSYKVNLGRKEWNIIINDVKDCILAEKDRREKERLKRMEENSKKNDSKVAEEDKNNFLDKETAIIIDESESEDSVIEEADESQFLSSLEVSKPEYSNDSSSSSSASSSSSSSPSTADFADSVTASKSSSVLAKDLLSLADDSFISHTDNFHENNQSLQESPEKEKEKNENSFLLDGVSVNLESFRHNSSPFPSFVNITVSPNSLLDNYSSNVVDDKFTSTTQEAFSQNEPLHSSVTFNHSSTGLIHIKKSSDIIASRVKVPKAFNLLNHSNSFHNKVFGKENLKTNHYLSQSNQIDYLSPFSHTLSSSPFDSSSSNSSSLFLNHNNNNIIQKSSLEKFSRTVSFPLKVPNTKIKVQRRDSYALFNRSSTNNEVVHHFSSSFNNSRQSIERSISDIIQEDEKRKKKEEKKRLVDTVLAFDQKESMKSDKENEFDEKEEKLMKRHSMELTLAESIVDIEKKQFELERKKREIKKRERELEEKVEKEKEDEKKNKKSSLLSNQNINEDDLFIDHILPSDVNHSEDIVTENNDTHSSFNSFAESPEEFFSHSSDDHFKDKDNSNLTTSQSVVIDSDSNKDDDNDVIEIVNPPKLTNEMFQKDHNSDCILNQSSEIDFSNKDGKLDDSRCSDNKESDESDSECIYFTQPSQSQSPQSVSDIPKNNKSVQNEIYSLASSNKFFSSFSSNRLSTSIKLNRSMLPHFLLIGQACDRFLIFLYKNSERNDKSDKHSQLLYSNKRKVKEGLESSSYNNDEHFTGKQGSTVNNTSFNNNNILSLTKQGSLYSSFLKALPYYSNSFISRNEILPATVSLDLPQSFLIIADQHALSERVRLEYFYLLLSLVIEERRKERRIVYSEKEKSKEITESVNNSDKLESKSKSKGNKRNELGFSSSYVAPYLQCPSSLSLGRTIANRKRLSSMSVDKSDKGIINQRLIDQLSFSSLYLKEPARIILNQEDSITVKEQLNELEVWFFELMKVNNNFTSRKKRDAIKENKKRNSINENISSPDINSLNSENQNENNIIMDEAFLDFDDGSESNRGEEEEWEVFAVPLVMGVALPVTSVVEFAHFFKNNKDYRTLKDEIIISEDELETKKEVQKEDKSCQCYKSSKLPLSNSFVPPPPIARLLASRACRGAVMFGDHLTYEEANILWEDVKCCSFPFECAHGRNSISVLADISEIINLETIYSTEKMKSNINENIYSGFYDYDVNRFYDESKGQASLKQINKIKRENSRKALEKIKRSLG